MVCNFYRTRALVSLLVLLSKNNGAQSQEPTQRVEASANLLENSSFEATPKQGDTPPGWQLWTNGETGYRCESVAGGRTGDRCLKVDGAGIRGVVFAKGVPIDRHKRYALRGWVKFQGDAGARALLLFHYFHNGKWLGLPDTVGVAATTDEWQLVTKTDRASEVPDASMIWISCTLEGRGTAWFDDVELVAYDRDKLPTNFEKEMGAANQPAEMALLGRRVGVWDVQTTIKPGTWNPQGLAMTGTEMVDWQLGKRLLSSRTDEQPGNVASLSLETYDPQSAAYRLWHFDSHGNIPRGDYAGHWDAAAKTLTYEGVDSAGVAVKSVQRWVSEDRVETHAEWRDKGGAVVMVLDKIGTRRP